MAGNELSERFGAIGWLVELSASTLFMQNHFTPNKRAIFHYHRVTCALYALVERIVDYAYRWYCHQATFVKGTNSTTYQLPHERSG
jgi:hypothetical protein